MAAVAVGIAAIPVVFLVLLPIVLFGRRGKLSQDVSAGRAVRQEGTFQVIESAGGGALVSNAGDLLAAYDESGRQLIGVAQA